MITFRITATGERSGFIEIVLTMAGRGWEVSPATAEKFLQAIYPSETFDHVEVSAL